MTNEDMIRPCMLWGETFDAYQNLNIIEGGIDSSLTCYKTLSYSDVKIIDNDGYLIVSKKCASAEKEDVLKVKMEAITTIADALNAPVLATEEVLAGLPKDAKIWVVESFSSEYGERITYDKATYGKWYDQEDYKYYGSSWVYKSFYNTVHHKQDDIHIEYPMRIQDGCKLRIIADKDDSKTAEYLRQFTLEGVRKETKDV